MFLSREIGIKLCQCIPKRIYVRYTSVSRVQKFLQWQCSILVTWYRWRHVTIILHCHLLEFWSPWSGRINNIINYIFEKWKIIKFKLQQEQTWVSQAPLGYRRSQIGCVIVEYDLFNTTNLIQNLTYIRFGIILTVLYQFLKTGISDTTLIGLNIAWDS